MSYAFTPINSQDKKFDFFGSYNYGIGNITTKVNPMTLYPFTIQEKKLKSGRINQIELGVFYHSFGLGIIHNAYTKNASTNYENDPLNGDEYSNYGTLIDKLNLSFNGLELLYKIPFFRKKLNVTGKIGLGFQAYSIYKDYNFMGTNPSHGYCTLTGNKLATIAGIEINYQLWKFIGIGIETSILPGNYTNLQYKDLLSFRPLTDDVTRLSTGLKIKITI